MDRLDVASESSIMYPLKNRARLAYAALNRAPKGRSQLRQGLVVRVGPELFFDPSLFVPRRMAIRIEEHTACSRYDGRTEGVVELRSRGQEEVGSFVSLDLILPIALEHRPERHPKLIDREALS